MAAQSISQPLRIWKTGPRLARSPQILSPRGEVCAAHCVLCFDALVCLFTFQVECASDAKRRTAEIERGERFNFVPVCRVSNAPDR